MVKNVTILAFLLLILSPNVWADTATKQDNAYFSMAEQAMTMPKNFNFIKLRDLYTKTSFFRPYTTNPKRDLLKITSDVEKDKDSSQKEFQKYIKKHFARFDTHTNGASVIANTPLKNDGKIHEWAGVNIFKTIMESGDGKTLKTAYKVINIQEEYLVLNGLEQHVGIKKQGRSTQNHNGQVYDVWNAIITKNKKPIQIYFNITIPFSKMDQSLSGHKK